MNSTLTNLIKECLSEELSGDRNEITLNEVCKDVEQILYKSVTQSIIKRGLQASAQNQIYVLNKVSQDLNTHIEKIQSGNSIGDHSIDRTA